VFLLFCELARSLFLLLGSPVIRSRFERAFPCSLGLSIESGSYVGLQKDPNQAIILTFPRLLFDVSFSVFFTKFENLSRHEPSPLALFSLPKSPLCLPRDIRLTYVVFADSLDAFPAFYFLPRLTLLNRSKLLFFPISVFSFPAPDFF